MKKSPSPNRSAKNRKGIALITVISVISILTILTVAMLSLSQGERKSAVKYFDGEFAKNLSDNAINLAMGQIWQGIDRSALPNGTGIWASQPGAIRQYQSNGAFFKGYKLYSDDQMVVTGNESQMANDTPDTNWQQKSGQWVDLNEPVIRPDSADDADDFPEVIFPIVDPRAFVRNTAFTSTGNNPANSSNIEGFSYQATMDGRGAGGIRDATSVTDTDARLPMPVQWLYQLKDGTIGHATQVGNTNEYTFVGPNGVTATAANPIVGRIAFWTDDESSKLNINTAGEPTFWAPPIAYHDRDYEWAVYPPTRFEYQRYPGHPATVALSTVLFPNKDLEVYGKTGSARSQAIAMKERIYEIMPKLNKGGSEAGTVPFWALNDPQYSGARKTRVDISNSLKEHLYASVDELIFSNKLSNGERLTQDKDPAASMPLFADHTNEERALERVRFFLTTQSRAPETNMFGLPRVAIWPVADASLGEEFRTVYDRLVAFCGTLGQRGGNNSYYFSRRDSTSRTTDGNIRRNQALLDYLYTLLGKDMPSGGAAASTFRAKYGPDAAQILMEIFDYVRSTNVADGVLSPSRGEILANPYRLDGLGTSQILAKRDALEPTRRTFTASRASTNYQVTGDAAPVNEQTPNNALPGHGQVTPTRKTIGGTETQGFGRFPMLSEVGLQFICTADGSTDSHSWRLNDGVADVISGGRTAGKVDGGIQPNTNGKTILAQDIDLKQPTDPVTGNPTSVDQYWYSNFPPYPAFGKYGTLTDTETQNPANANNPRHPKKHPGYYPENWNASLDRDTPLLPGQRRIQALLNLELTTLGGGFAGLYPDFCIEITGMNNFRLRPASGAGRPIALFNAIGGATKSFRPQHNLFSAYECRVSGGSVGPSATVSGRGAPDNLNMSKDPHYDGNVGATGKTYLGDKNYDFLSSFVTVSSASVPGGPPPTMRFEGGEITINIYSSRDVSPANLIQTYRIAFPNDATIPVPELVVLGSPHQQWQNSLGQLQNQYKTEAPHWWAFNAAGALRRWKMPNDADIYKLDPATDVYLPGLTPAPYTPGGGKYIGDPNLFTDSREYATYGRFFNKGSTGGGSQPTPIMGGIIYGTGTAANSPYYRLPNQPPGPIPANKGHGYITPGAEGPFGADVVVSMVPRHGDFRLLAAKKDVPASDWLPHPDFGLLPDANFPSRGYNGHSFTRQASAESGATKGNGANPNNQLAAATPSGGRYEDFPDTALSIGGAAGVNSSAARLFGDFDTGLATLRDGPWINRADEGNTGVDNVQDLSKAGGLARRPTAYYDDNWRSADAGDAFMTPNRMMPSPGVFGSLSTGVNAGVPWRTLLFRPFVSPPQGSLTHPGSPNYAGATSAAFRGTNPADHYLMDLFWMPVVEPYAISEPLSTAGKVNMNYQMVPFNKYIRRATGMHAVLKGEMLEAFPTSYPQRVHGSPSGAKNVANGVGYGEYYQVAKWTDVASRATDAFYPVASNPAPLQYWHRFIDLETKAGGRGTVASTTMSQFDDRFEFRTSNSSPVPQGAFGLFRTASQICEVHLVPKKIRGDGGNAFAREITTGNMASPPVTDGSDENPTTPYSWSNMSAFWTPRSITGENLRERPYTNIYAKVTTQSNTFRVHYRAQAIRKARSVDPNVFNPVADSVTSDFRGSAIIERRIDPEDSRIPDYATTPSTTPLDDFYSFRVLENKRFAP